MSSNHEKFLRWMTENKQIDLINSRADGLYDVLNQLNLASAMTLLCAYLGGMIEANTKREIDAEFLVSQVANMTHYYYEKSKQDKGKF